MPNRMTAGFLRDSDTSALIVKFVGAAGTGALHTAQMADTPLGLWRAVDGVDASGTSHPLTPFGSPTAGPSLDDSDASNGSMVFNDTNNLWNPEKYAAFDLTAAVSLSFLIKPTVVGVKQDLVRKGVYYGVWLGGDNKLHAEIVVGGSGIEAVGATTIVVNTRYHVGMAFNGSNLKLYVNGAQDATAVASGTLDVNNAQSFTIGISNTDGYTGAIDEVALYSTALAAGRFDAHATAAGL